MHHDPCAAAGGGDGRLVRRLPHRHPAQGARFAPFVAVEGDASRLAHVRH